MSVRLGGIEQIVEGELYMFSNSQNEDHKTMCTSTDRGSKLMYLIIGGGLGATIALLFAPKPGRELRQDIADTAVKGYDKTLAAASRTKEQAVEYYESAKEKGDEVLDAVADRAFALKNEIVNDAAKISEIIQGTAGRVSDSIKRDQPF